jgi:hypothetical protein
MRYEVWSYSKSWKKWIRNIYPSLDDAQKRYERLRAIGRTVKPPQPMNTGLPLLDRLKTFFIQPFMRKKRRKRKKEVVS